VSWIQKLYETHAAISDLAVEETKIPFIPESHSTARMHIEVTLNAKGKFNRASVIDKQNATTIIPCTEASATRAGSKPVPHPLCDSLQYVAGDFRAYGGQVTSGFAADMTQPRADYLKQLQSWVEAAPHPATQAVLAYVRDGHVVQDLVKSHILPLNAGGNIAKSKEEGGADFPIWSVLPPGQSPQNAVVRWRVERPGQTASGVWEDQSLFENWQTYYPNSITDENLCMVSGMTSPLTSLHPAKLRHAGDKAKLISANDSSGFTFRGRFTDDNGSQACGVSYEVSQKAHNVLRWLIARQGYKNGNSQVVVSWAVSGKTIPPVFDDSPDPIGGPPDFSDEHAEIMLDHTRNVGQNFAEKLNQYIAGYAARIEPTEDIVVLTLDSATPGRMSIAYYRELRGSEFLERLRNWHSDMAWQQRLTFTGPQSEGKKPKTKTVWRDCAPTPRAIAEAVHGRKLDDNLRKSTVERLLPCIVDGRALPRDLMESCVRRAANRPGFKEHWEWEQALGVACALFKGYHAKCPNRIQRRVYDMALEPARTTRDYLYGRLLAIAEHIEGVALSVAGENRPTTAARLMQRFSDHPCSTWRNIELALQPYIQRLQNSRGGFLHNMCVLLDEVLCLFQENDFQSEAKLSGEFLLGYHCQRQEWKKNKNDVAETEGAE